MSDEMKAGDRSAQVGMTADVSRRLRAVASKLLHDRGDAEDLVQHAWLTYVKTVRSGVVVREVEAFLVGGGAQGSHERRASEPPPSGPTEGRTGR